MTDPKPPDLGSMVRGQDDLQLAIATALLAIDLAEKAGAEEDAVERVRDIIRTIISPSGCGTST